MARTRATLGQYRLYVQGSWGGVDREAEPSKASRQPIRNKDVKRLLFSHCI